MEREKLVIDLKQDDTVSDNPCEACYFEDVCMQTEFCPVEIRKCESKKGQYWELRDQEDYKMFTYKIWNIKEQKYMDNAGASTARAAYDCFPEKAVKQIAGRLCGKGNYEVQRFKLERSEI